MLGNSMGGYSALYAVDRGLMAQYFRHFKERFRAAVAYYPNCGIPATMMTAPTLILIGEAVARSTTAPAKILGYESCCAPIWRAS